MPLCNNLLEAQEEIWYIYITVNWVSDHRKETLLHMNTTLRNRRLIGFFIAAVLGIIGAFLLFWLLAVPPRQRDDFKKISSTEFDTVFLSMYPTDPYHEEDFAHYRAMTLFKASYCIPSPSVLNKYMKKIARCGNTVTTAYLGIRPDLISPEELEQITSLYPSVVFEVILAYPSAEYWQQLSSEDYEELLSAYRAYLTAAPHMAGVNCYFYGAEEWLIANPSNYENPWQLNEALSLTVMLHSDSAHAYLVTEQNALTAARELSALTLRLRTAPFDYPDLSGYHLVFFGDSVIGNYTDSASIPGVAAGLTGAAVYNCGYGGNSAAMGEKCIISLPGIVEAFFQGDLSLLPPDTQVYQGVRTYLDNPPQEGSVPCFIINYGLNDYFSGYPVASSDPYAIDTYCGAIRTAVQSIRSHASPDAQIILCSPTFSSLFQDGTQLHSSVGGQLSDYADAVKSLARELNTDLLDNYYDLGITHDNQGEYLEDQVHPNARCRFRIGCRIIDLVR